MNESIAWLRPLIFLVAALFVGAVVVRTISDAAHDRHRLEDWLRKAMAEPESGTGRESRCCPCREGSRN
ncbi:MAG TPA: hypothetical protein VJS65_16105 [Verrucomicrobiae bacterium]|nr:hypothetical protein [Verrucomicrobiae bacterium]